jgi:hypothetical protein
MHSWCSFEGTVDKHAVLGLPRWEARLILQGVSFSFQGFSSDN